MRNMDINQVGEVGRLGGLSLDNQEWREAYILGEPQPNSTSQVRDCFGVAPKFAGLQMPRQSHRLGTERHFFALCIACVTCIVRHVWKSRRLPGLVLLVD